MVHLTFLVGQLTRAVTRCSIDHCRRHNLGISALAGFVEEEVDQCTLQPRSLADVDRKTSTGNLYAEVKVDEVVFLGKFPVGQWVGDTQRWVHVPVAYRVRIGTFFQVRLHHVVILCGGTLRHLVVGNVGYLAKQPCHLLLRVVHGLLQLLVGFLHLGHRRFDALGFFAFAFLHQCTDLCSKFLGFSQVLVQLLLCLAATLVYGQYFVDSLLGAFEMFLLQSADNAFCLFCNKL